MSDESIEQIRAKIDKHSEDIITLQNDYRHLTVNVDRLSDKVDKLSNSLLHLDNTILTATTSFNTLVTVMKFIAGTVALGSTVLGIYLTLN